MITSIQNPHIKNVVKLRKASERKKQNLIIIEGQKELRLAQMAGLQFTTLYYSSELAGQNNLESIAVCEEVSKKVFLKISYRENPDGFLALAKPRHLSLERVKLSASPLIIVLENVEKPGNLGAVLRTGDAVRADAVIVCAPRTDIYNPNVIRASLGTVFTSQVLAGSSREIISWLKQKGIKIYASTPGGASAYTKADYHGPCAIVIGAEHSGLSDTWLEEADQRIRIPMHGQIDSLNASASAAVILYEAIRQRAGKAKQ